MHWIIGSLLCTAWAAAAGAEPGRIIFVQIPARNLAQPGAEDGDATPEDGLPPGSRIVLYDQAGPANSLKNLTPQFAAAGKPDVSFDGKRILFIGRHGPRGPSQLWEMDAEGGGLRRITDQSGGFTAAIYLSTMFTLDAEEPVYQIGFSRNAGGALANALFTCRMDGTRIRQITFDANRVSDPLLLSDGRLLYTRWLEASDRTGGASDRSRPPSTPPWEGGRTTAPALAVQPEAASLGAVQSSVPRRLNTDLLTVYPDGMDVSGFAATDEPPAIRSMPCETPDGLVVYVESPIDSPDRGGALVAVSRARGLHTRQVLADDSDGVYHSPSAMPDGKLLVSHRPKTGGSYGVYVFDPADRTGVARVFDDPQWHEVDGVVLGPRVVPAGRSSSVREEIDYGFLYCMDAYISDSPATGSIQPGRIKRLRVLKSRVQSTLPSEEEGKVRGRQSMTDAAPSPLLLSLKGRGGSPAPSSSKGQAGDPLSVQTNAGVQVMVEEVLGEVQVEADGSFSLQVPARVPLRLQTLDADGRLLQDMTSWIWVMSKEARGCIGCHEDRELTPPNRQTQALRNLPLPVGVDIQVDSARDPEDPYQRGPSQ